MCPSRHYKTPCEGPHPKSIRYYLAHQLFIDTLPLVIEAIEQGRAINREMIRKSQKAEEKNNALEVTKKDILSKINNLLSQQEIRFSELREARIAQLEAELKQLQAQEIIKPAARLISVPPSIDQILSYVSPQDIDELKSLAPMFFNEIYFTRLGNQRSERYEAHKVVLSTDVILSLSSNGKYYQN
jgi:hypothetical protein